MFNSAPFQQFNSMCNAYRSRKVNQRDLASQYGITPSQVSQLLRKANFHYGKEYTLDNRTSDMLLNGIIHGDDLIILS